MGSKDDTADELMSRRFRMQHAPRALMDKSTLAKRANKRIKMKCIPSRKKENDPHDPGVHRLPDAEETRGEEPDLERKSARHKDKHQSPRQPNDPCLHDITDAKSVKEGEEFDVQEAERKAQEQERTVAHVEGEARKVESRWKFSVLNRLPRSQPNSTTAITNASVSMWTQSWIVQDAYLAVQVLPGRIRQRIEYHRKLSALKVKGFFLFGNHSNCTSAESNASVIIWTRGLISQKACQAVEFFALDSRQRLNQIWKLYTLKAPFYLVHLNQANSTLADSNASVGIWSRGLIPRNACQAFQVFCLDSMQRLAYSCKLSSLMVKDFFLVRNHSNCTSVESNASASIWMRGLIPRKTCQAVQVFGSDSKQFLKRRWKLYTLKVKVLFADFNQTNSTLPDSNASVGIWLRGMIPRSACEAVQVFGSGVHVLCSGSRQRLEQRWKLSGLKARVFFLHRYHTNSTSNDYNSSEKTWAQHLIPQEAYLALQLFTADTRQRLNHLLELSAWPARFMERLWLSQRVSNAVTLLLAWSAGVALTRHQHFAATAVVISRLVLFVYAVAFASLAPQADGLMGPAGISPQVPRHNVSNIWDRLTLSTLRQQRPGYVATLASVVAFLSGVLPSNRIAGMVAATAQIWLCAVYEKFMKGGSSFLLFQWDSLLLESGVLGAAAALAVLPATALSKGICSALTVNSVINLGFKLMWGSFASKIQFGCPEWRSGRAMRYHHRTTCIPKPLSRALHLWTQRGTQRSCVQVWAILLTEGPLSLLALSGFASARAFCALTWIGLNLAMACSGNYGFFNLNTCALAVALLEDRFLGRLAICMSPVGGNTPSRWAVPFDMLLTPAALAAWIVYAAATIAEISESCNSSPPTLAKRGRKTIRPFFCLGSHYGLFAAMTTIRDEIVIRELHPLPEALANISRDYVKPAGEGRYWVEIALPYKPGPLNRAPPFLLAHMPRLDWDMWNVALDWALAFSANEFWDPPLWFKRFLKMLSERSPGVVRLVQHAGEPSVQQHVLKLMPLAVRVSLEDYHFTDPQHDTKLGERWEQGRWWRRQVIDVYNPFPEQRA